MPFCTRCGSPLPEGDPACPACSAGPAPVREPEPLVWSRRVPLITNSILIRDFFFSFMGAGFFICTILVLLTGQPDLYIAFFSVFFGMFLLCLLIMAGLEWRYGGGLETFFFISSEGAAHRAGRTMRSLNRGTALLSGAGGPAAAAGTGLIAISQEVNVLEWKDVRHVRVYQKLRFIELRSRFLINPVALYCTEENFPRVLSMVKKFVPVTVSIRIHV